ncbi:MAG: urease accessory protein UreF [Burkholderiaceae bacterium]|jgi:urease accessory protein|nr:urease accessory protein UreF [Burkholderiaceae bacterium]
MSFPQCDDEPAATPKALLELMQLASPALPVGGFSYSEGLEAAVEAGLVRDEAGAGDWLLDQLHLSLARADLPVLAQAVPAWRASDLDRIQALNDWVRFTRESAELLQQTQQMGRSLAEWLKNRGTADERIALLAALRPAPTWPVSFALAATLSGAPLRDVLLSFGFGWAENMVQAAMRSVPLGQSAAQRILARLIDALPGAVEHAAGLSDAQRQAFTPMLAILSAQHETQYSRLFRS